MLAGCEHAVAFDGFGDSRVHAFDFNNPFRQR
jgi:hypothetical protein